MANGPNEYDCIVLGAGIAGVTAARDVHQGGFKVLLVEGSDRIGGRMYSRTDFVRHPDHVGDAARFPLEAGAEYVHIGDRERFPEFFAELERHGFVTEKYPKTGRNRMAFPQWGDNPRTLLDALRRSGSLLRAVPLLFEVEAYDRSGDVPAGTFIRRRFPPLRRNGIALGRYTLSSHTPGQLYDPDVDPRASPPAGAVDNISIAGFQADKLPHQLVKETAEYKMGRRANGDVFEVRPYDELPRSIARQLEDASLNPRGQRGEILLGHSVIKVEKADPGVVVTVETPAGDRRRLRAKSVVCTFSVGMLASATGAGIFGGLLASKREALKSILMGPITKFSLEFKENVWGQPPMTVLSGPASRARTFFSVFPDRPNGPFVLTGLLMNQDHRVIQALDDEAAVQHLLDVLQRLFDPGGSRWTAASKLVERSPGEPNFLRQDWERDPFARGGNSFIAFRPELDRAAVGRLRQTLREPDPDVPLFWAGEATAPAYDPRYQPLAVHGAYRSGVGAARDVRKFLTLGPEAFRRSLDQELALETTASVVAAESAPRPITVQLTAGELEAIRRHAAEDSDDAGGDLGQAALELLRIGLYLQLNEPLATEAAAVPEVLDTAIELVPSAVEVETLRGVAAELTGGDLERAIRNLIRRALGELGG